MVGIESHKMGMMVSKAGHHLRTKGVGTSLKLRTAKVSEVESLKRRQEEKGQALQEEDEEGFGVLFVW